MVKYITILKIFYEFYRPCVAEQERPQYVDSEEIRRSFRGGTDTLVRTDVRIPFLLQPVVITRRSPRAKALAMTRLTSYDLRLTKQNPPTGVGGMGCDINQHQLVMVISVSLSKMWSFSRSKATSMVSPGFAVEVGATRAVIWVSPMLRYR